MNQNASRTPLQGAATQNAAATAGHHKDAPAAAHQKAMMEAMQITGFDGPAGLRYAEARYRSLGRRMSRSTSNMPASGTSRRCSRAA